MPKSFAAEGLRKPGAATTPLVHLQVPPGMDAALRGLTREVLRRQPSDLYLFAHRYFESLLAARVAQQEGEEITDSESLFSKKQSMRDLFQEDESKRSREIVHRIHLEGDSSPDKNVVHNINIEVEGEDASIEETTVKVEITGDEGKKKRRENRDSTSFAEEVTTTRTEHMTVCKSWKVETRVETSESGEIRVESFTNAGKTKQTSKPRKFASEEGKKSTSLIEEEKRAAKAQREKAKRESSKSKSFENVDRSASRELIMLERQAAAQNLKTDEGKTYQSFVRLDDSAADESERLIEIEREEALTRSRRDVGDSTREVSPDLPSVLPQSPQVALQKMEESLIQLKELEAKAESLKRKDDVSQVLSEVADEKLHGLVSPENALLKMERSLIELKETSLASATETRKDEILTDLGKDSLDVKQSISMKSEGESKSSDIMEEKHKIIESVKGVVHEIEDKAYSVSSHIHGTQTTEEKQSNEESKSLEDKHKIIENVKEVVHKIEDKTASVLSHIHGSKSSEENQSLKSEDESFSEKRHKIIEDVKEVVHEIEEKTSNVLTHFPEKTETSIEKTEIDLNPNDKESIVVEAEIEAEQISEPKKVETSAVKTEVLEASADDRKSITVNVEIEEEEKKMEDEKTEVLDPSTDDKESIEVEVQIEIERGYDPEMVEHEKAKTTELNLEGTEGMDLKAESLKQSPEPASAEKTDALDQKGTERIVQDTGMREEAVEEGEENLGKMETSAAKTEALDQTVKKSIVMRTRMKADDEVKGGEEKLGEMKSSAEKTEALGLKGKESIVEEESKQKDDEVEDTSERLEKMESSAKDTEPIELTGKEYIAVETRMKAANEVEDAEEKLGKMESSAENSEALDLKGKESMQKDDEVEEAKEKLEKMKSSAEDTEALDLKGKESIVEEECMQKDVGVEETKEKLEEIGSFAEKTETLGLKGKESIVEEERMQKDVEVEEAKEKLEKMGSSADETEAFDLKGKESIVEEERMQKDVGVEETKEKHQKIESSAEETEALGLKGKESIVEEELMQKDDEVENAEKKLGKMESSAEKNEALDLEDKQCIVLETRMKKDEVEDEEKGSLEPKLKTEEADGKKEQKYEFTPEGRHKRDVGEAKVIEKAEDKAASDEKPDSDHGRSKEESTEEGLARPSFKEEKQTSSQLSKEVDDKKKEEQKVSTVEGHGKETEGEKSSAESTKTEHDDSQTEMLFQKEDVEESPGEQAEKRIADGSTAEEGGEKEGANEDAILLSRESEHKTVAKTTEKASEDMGVEVEGKDGGTVGAGLSVGKDIHENLASKAEHIEKISGHIEDNATDEPKSSAEKETLEVGTNESTVVRDEVVGDSASQALAVKGEATTEIRSKELSVAREAIPESKSKELFVAREATPESKSKELSVEREASPEVKSKELSVEKQKDRAGETVEEQAVKAETVPGDAPSDKDTSKVVRVRRSMEETFTKTEEMSESISTSIMTQTILLGGPENEVKSMQTEVKEHQKEKSETKTHVVKREEVDIDDVFGHKMYPIEEVNTLLETAKKQDDGASVEVEIKIEDSPQKISEPVPESPGEVKAQDSVESSDEVKVEDSAAKSKEEEGSLRRESSEEKPRQRKLASLDEESSSVSEGTGDGFLPPTVVISRVADVVELTDGEAKIISQMEKEGLTTEYDENIKIKTGHWSAEDANKFLTGESQHTYHTLRKPELVYSDLHESRPPEKSLSEKLENPVSHEPEKSSEVEDPSIECLVEEQEESSPDKTDSLGQDSYSKGSPVKFSLVEIDDNGKKIKEDKPWLARAHTVEEFFEKETVGELIPVVPTPPRRSSVPGQVDVMMEMSKATSRIGQSIMVLSGEEKHPVQRSDSDEYCISQDAIYIPLRPPGTEPEIVEESDDETFRIDQVPPTFTYDSDEGEWGAALTEHVKKDPSLTTVIIERKVDDPSALGRVTITEITDEEEKATTTEHAKESKVNTVEELPKPVFEIGSPVSDRSTDLSELRTDAKHRPSLADISEENLESADDNEGSMNVELHISLSDGDNLSQRSYGTDSERKWTDDLSNVAHKAKDAATGMIKNLFGSSPRKDRHSPARSESSIVSEASTDGGKRTRTRSESKEESEREKEPQVVEYETKVEMKSTKSTDKEDSHGASKLVVDTKSTSGSQQTGKDLPGEEKVEDRDKITPRSLHGSSETSQSLTSVSLPLPDASYDLPNVTSSTSTVDSRGASDVKDIFKDDVPSDSSKPLGYEGHQIEESHRLKRSAEQDEVAKDQSVDKKKAEGSGAAAGTAVQNAAEVAQGEHEKDDTRVSAKDPKEAGMADQEPASEPKDSMTSVISETLDSVESLPSEVSKTLWSIEDVPLGENLNESGVQDEQKDTKNTAAREGEGSSKMKVGVVDEVLGTIERQVETVQERVDDLKDTAEEEVKRGEEKVGKVAREAKEDVRHKLARAAEVVEDSLEDFGKGGKEAKSEVDQELNDKSEAIKGALTTAKDNIEGEIKDVQKSAEGAKEEVEKIGKDIQEKVYEGESEVVETVQKERSKVGAMLDNVGETIHDAKEKVASVFHKGEQRVEDLGHKASKTADEISANVSENITEIEDNVEEKVEKGKSGLGKFIGGVTDAISEVKEKVSETVTHVKEDVKSMASKTEKRVEKDVSEIKGSIEEEATKVESGIESKMEEAGKLKSKVADDVKCSVLKGTDKVTDIAGKAEDEVEQIRDEIGEEVEKAKEVIEGTVHEVAEEVKQTAKKVGGKAEITADEGAKIAEPISKKELDEVEKRLEESIERADDGIDTVDGIKEVLVHTDDIDHESKAKDVGESEAEETSTTRMVLDKRKGDGDKVEEVEASKVLTRSIEDQGTVASAHDVNTDSSGKEDSSETRRSKRHILKRGVTVGDLPRSVDTIPSESVDEASLERADTVIHRTPDELEVSEPTRQEEVVVPIHVEHQEATPVPPGKDTKATETDLLEKETVSRGTEPEETSEQIAEALRSEVKDLEERLSRLRESTWSLSHTGPDSRKGEGDVHASKSHVDGTDDANERTVHVKKSISSAESMSFASRVLSTPMGSVREEFSEMKKSMAETTLETVLTVEKGVQSEGGEVGGRGDTGPKTTATTATQVSVPSNETSDDESRKTTFQRAKSMDAKTEARAITNFSKRNTNVSKRNSRGTVETKKTDSSRTQKKSEHAKE